MTLGLAPTRHNPWMKARMMINQASAWLMRFIIQSDKMKPLISVYAVKIFTRTEHFDPI